MKCTKCNFETSELRAYNYHKLGHLEDRKIMLKVKADDHAVLKPCSNENKLINFKVRNFRRIHRDSLVERKQKTESGPSSQTLFRTCKDNKLIRFNIKQNSGHIHRDIVDCAQSKTCLNSFNHSADTSMKHSEIKANQEEGTSVEEHAFVEVKSLKSVQVECPSKCNLRQATLTPVVVAPSLRKLYQCTRCDFHSNYIVTWQKHMNSHSEGKLYQCFNCCYSTKNLEEFQLHKSLHGRSNEVEYGDSLATTQKESKIRQRDVSGARVYDCSKCPYKARLKHHVKRHELIHLEVKQFKCPNCEYETNNLQCLARHKVKHLKFKYLKCGRCTYSTNITEDLKRHKLRHLKVKLFKCSQCDYSTNRKFLLDHHQFDHMNVKLFKCSACNYGSNLKTNLIKHEKIHLKVKSHKCSICTYKTNRLDHLKKHHKVHKPRI